jgi:hypothetical protein
MHAELLSRGHTPASTAAIDDVPTAQRMLGMDEEQPWHALRITLPIADDPQAWFEDAVRGRDEAEALANAAWNWPAATGFTYLGHSYEVGDPIVEVTDANRIGVISGLRPYIADRQGIRVPVLVTLLARFDGEDHDVEVSRDQIRFTGNPPETSR